MQWPNLNKLKAKQQLTNVKRKKDSREINSAILQILQQHLLYQDLFVLHNQQCMLCRPRALSESKCKQNYNHELTRTHLRKFYCKTV